MRVKNIQIKFRSISATARYVLQCKGIGNWQLEGGYDRTTNKITKNETLGAMETKIFNKYGTKYFLIISKEGDKDIIIPMRWEDRRDYYAAISEALDDITVGMNELNINDL